jgi:DNA-binding MarR family transcriptional regulator
VARQPPTPSEASGSSREGASDAAAGPATDPRHRTVQAVTLILASWLLFGYTAPMETADRVATLERIVVGAVGLTARALAEAAPGMELTFPQWRALLILGERADGARVGEVASRAGVTLPATSRLLHRLERRSLVALATDPADRRATRARLSVRGREVRMAILDYRRAALGEVSREVDPGGGGAAGADLAAVARALERFA